MSILPGDVVRLASYLRFAIICLNSSLLPLQGYESLLILLSLVRSESKRFLHSAKFKLFPGKYTDSSEKKINTTFMKRFLYLVRVLHKKLFTFYHLRGSFMRC